jgi:hypothetical protein
MRLPAERWHQFKIKMEPTISSDVIDKILEGYHLNYPEPRNIEGFQLSLSKKEVADILEKTLKLTTSGSV